VNNQSIGGRQDCQVDTDSKSNVYVVWDGIDNKTKQLALFMVVDPNTGDLTFDGLAGARDGLAPSLSIANGAPTGTGANDEIVVVRTASVGGGGAIGEFSDLHRAATGDARGSSANAQDSVSLVDYNAMVSTKGFAVAAWNDARFAADSPAEDAYRQAFSTSSPLPRPAPNNDCPSTFGNTDIWSGTFAR
jgi:hypothetical protein